MEITENTPVGAIVAEDIRTASVFTKVGIDFCCGGKKSLGESCREAGTDLRRMVGELTSLMETPVGYNQDFKAWDPGFLADYIVQTHHRFVKQNLPELQFYTRKIADVHGENHPELGEVARLFGEVAAELTQHMAKEEEVLFPAGKRLLQAVSDAVREVMQTGSASDREVVQSEIGRMKGEHDFAGGAMDHIHQITGGYRVPADGCNTYRVAFDRLRAFEEDLHVHVHLENNILFPALLKA